MAFHTFLPAPYVPVLNNANAAPSKTETTGPGHVNDLDARVVHAWRHILQKTFLSNDPAPNPTRFDVCRRIYDQLEHVDMRVEWYISSKLGKVLRHIAASPQAEDGTEARIADDLYKFRERAVTLVLAIHLGIVGQTIPSERRESHASDAAAINPRTEAQDVVAGSIVWPSTLPLELHIAILRCSLIGVSGARSHATDVTKVWNLWRSDTDFLRTCALVSKAWATPAQWLLYSSRIILVTKKSLQRLLWTTTQLAYRPPLKHLAVHYYEPFDDFGVSLTSLIQQSTRLHTLELERGFPAFSVGGLAVFEHLSTLRLVDQAFLEIAPMLCRLPNLETLVLHSVRDMLPQHRPTTIPGLASSVSELEPLTFRLRRLEVSLVFISSAHLTWLLASSVKSLQHVSISPISHLGAGVVDGFPDVYEHLSSLLGTHVTSLHVARCDHRRRHPNLQQVLRRWRNVTDLHIEGYAGLEAVVSDVGSLPSRLTVSCPWQCIEDVATALRDLSWQRQLQEISVFETPNILLEQAPFAVFDVLATHRRSAPDMLRAACEARNIVLHWQSRC